MIRNMFEEMKRLQEQINKSFGDFWGTEKNALPDYTKNYPELRIPLADLQETENEIIASFEIPGVDKKDIQLNVTENKIEVKIEKKQEAKIEKKGYFKEEKSYKGFYKAMSLPAEVIPEKTKASYKNGVLEVEMSKAKKERKKQIKIE